MAARTRAPDDSAAPSYCRGGGAERFRFFAGTWRNPDRFTTPVGMEQNRPLAYDLASGRRREACFMAGRGSERFRPHSEEALRPGEVAGSPPTGTLGLSEIMARRRAPDEGRQDEHGHLA